VQKRFGEILDFTDPDYPEETTEVAASMFNHYTAQMEKLSGVQANPTANGELKSVEIFDLIHSYLIKEGAVAVKTCGAIYNFEIKRTKKGNVERTWGIDLKNGTGSVSLTPFATPDSTFTMTDDDFYSVCMGKLNPQVAFLQVSSLLTP